MIGQSDELTVLFLGKLEEQIERTLHLITLIPDDKIDWQPQLESHRVCDLLGHLLECLAGFCATLYAVKSDDLAHFGRLRTLPVNHCCGINEASERIREYLTHIRQGMALLGDGDLARRVPTVFVPGGEAVMTLLLGNLEHLINHKYQLFFYLKLIGIPVNTADLYSIR